MVLKVNRAHAVAPVTKHVSWDLDAGVFVTEKLVNKQFQPVAVTHFAMDIWQAQHGWEVWSEVGGKKQRSVVMASVSAELPKQPEGGKPLYTVPVCGQHLGGTRELVIKGVEVTASFVDLLETLAEPFAKLNELLLPIIEVTSKETDYGLAPVFSIENLMPRPKHWKPPIVSFK
jgi:hypothetical protein